MFVNAKLYAVGSCCADEVGGVDVGIGVCERQ